MPERPLLVTIDGDGFIYRNRETGRPVAEILLEQVLKAFPFTFTASVIAGEIETYPDEFDSQLAARIFALDNVRPASHSWSHPHDWTEGVDVQLEVGHSIRTIEERLLPAGKRVETFLWSGRCNPTRAALAAAERAGVANLNGGNRHEPYRQVGRHRHYSSRAPNDWELMGLEELVMRGPPPRPHPYEFLRSYEGSLDGFRDVIRFFEAHPELPIHVYFHWYSAVRWESLDALLEVLRWCQRQSHESVSVREYVARMNAAAPTRSWRRALSWVRGRVAVGGRRRGRNRLHELPDWWSPPRPEPTEPRQAQSPYEGVRRSGFFDPAVHFDEDDTRPAPPLLILRGSKPQRSSTLRWSEHCVECAAPACYEACDMYVPSESGCRRFLHGLETTREHATVLETSQRIVFLPWGNLLAVLKEPLEGYDGFLLEVVNPAPEPVPLVVDFRGPVGPERTRLMVKEQARSGMNQFFYPLDLIGAFVSLPALSEVAIAPETSSPETLLYFPMREFVRLDPEATRSLDAGRVKCVAFDLDDTLWRGILVEDGPNALELDEEVAVRIRQLGEIGIITSVVSKNDPAEALRLLDDFGLREFFVFPQIGWGPKSEALRRLSESLRIGVGSILLVDDSRHERAAVEATVAGAQTIGPEELDLVCNTLLSRKRLERCFCSPRASYYRTEEARQSAEAGHGGDHLRFLRSLRARVGMAPPTEKAMDRVQELIQRTNRLNFSGHRYTRPEVARLVADGCRYRCWTVTASDRFGDYGLVGFVIVDVSDPVRWHVQDLMFSCRILGRHVDLFVLTRVLEEARAARAEKVTVAFESSGRNEAAREALVHAGFVESDGRGYVFDLDDGEIRTIDYIEAA